MQSGSTFQFEDPTGLLEWITNDRAKVDLKTMEEIEAQAEELARVARGWVMAVSIGEQGSE